MVKTTDDFKQSQTGGERGRVWGGEMILKAPRKIELKYRYVMKKRESDDSFLNSKII